MSTPSTPNPAGTTPIEQALIEHACRSQLPGIAGDDAYQTRGFSLASAAHNAMVLFRDDAGSDRYADTPAHAGSNEYHGGKSFALFVDQGGGSDTYGGEDAKSWNDRVLPRDQGAYFLDLPKDDRPWRELMR